MRSTKSEHIVDWFATHRLHLANLKTSLPQLNREDKLQLIRKQYAVLANMEKVCLGEAFFIGVPRQRALPDTGED